MIPRSFLSSPKGCPGPRHWLGRHFLQDLRDSRSGASGPAPSWWAMWIFPTPLRSSASNATRWRPSPANLAPKTAYGLTSLSPEKASPTCLLALNRNHWSHYQPSFWVPGPPAASARKFTVAYCTHDSPWSIRAQSIVLFQLPPRRSNLHPPG